MNTLPVNCKRVWLNSLLIIFLFAPATGGAQQANIEWIKPLADWNGRVVVWQVGGLKYVVAQPVSLQIHSDSAGTPSLGFVHSGYTSEDPDGKTALLNVTVESVKRPLTEQELTTLRGGGMTVDGPVQIQNGPWSIDIHLNADKNEERRIRNAIGFPRQVPAGASSIPIQIRWENISGDQLFNWLTSANDGLTIVLQTDASGVYTIRKTFVLVRTKILGWFDGISPHTSSIQWRGDAIPALQSMVEYGCLEDADHPGISLHMTGIAADFLQLAQKLDQFLLKNGDNSILKRDAIAQKDLTFDSELQIKVPLSIELDVLPGKALLKHPDLVKDLSGNGKGIEAIKHP